jgi:hypothetical protein
MREIAGRFSRASLSRIAFGDHNRYCCADAAMQLPKPGIPHDGNQALSEVVVSKF